MKKLYTKLSQTRNLRRISAFPKLALIIAVLLPSLRSAAQPVVTITGNVPCAVSSTLTANSSIQPARIIWFENGTQVSEANATWNAIATTIAGTGTAGTGLNQLSGPYSIYVDGAGNTYVADFLNNRIIEFPFGNTTGTVVAGSATGASGNTLALLNGPSGVWLDAAGNIYVTDQGNNRVMEFPAGSTAGTNGTVVAGGMGYGNAANQLAAPFGVVVDGAGNIFVADEQNNRIMEWAPAATSGTVFAGTGVAGAATTQLNNPTGLFIDAAGTLYVADYNNNRVMSFPAGSTGGTAGTVVAGGNGQGNGLNQLDHPTGVFVDGLSNVYVADANNNRVMQWPSAATTGIMAAGTGVAGTGNTQLNHPYSVWVDGNGLMNVADYNNNRVQQFTPNIVSTYTTTIPDPYTATVYTFTGANATAGVTVTTPPYITSSPVDETICANNGTSFSVTAGGTALTYQWQVSTNGGGTFSDITTGGGVYTGYTSATLNLANTPAGYDGYVYRAIVSGSCTPSATSGTATLTVNTAAAITTNPTDANICEAGTTSFTSAATGTSISYQWQVSTNSGVSFTDITTGGGVYSGFTSATLTLANVTNAMNTYQYRVVVTSATCPPPATSTAATLTVTPLPVIVTQPMDQTVCEGQNATFTTTATGAGLMYQWQVSTDGGLTFNDVINVTPFTGAQTPTLMLVGVSATLNGAIYRNQISSNLGQCPLNTNNATLTVWTLPAVTTPPSDATICAGDNTSFTVAATGTNLTYQWQVSTNGGTTYADLTNTAPYSNVTAATMNVTGAAATMNGYMYQVLVSGACTPPVTSTPPATLTVNTAPAITTQPVNTPVCVGSNTSFTVAATGTNLTYQWQVSTNGGTTYTDLTNTAPYSNVTTATLNITNATLAIDNNMYRVVVSGTCPAPVTSTGATLNVRKLPAITGQPSNATICEGSNTIFSVTATGAMLTYQWQVSINGGVTYSNLTNAGVYTGVHSANLNITGATAGMNNYMYQVVVSGACTPSVTSNPATLTVNTLPAITTQPTGTTVCAGDNASFSVTATGTGITYQWQVSTNGGSTYTNATGGVYSNGTTATLNITGATAAMNGYLYQVLISGACTPSVTSSPAVTLNVNTSPVITTQPSNTIACEGSNTSFTVVATGSALTYQWQVSTNGGTTYANVTGAPYSNATTATLNITGVTTALNGNLYKVIVSGACIPAVTSSPSVSLTVNTLPTITTQPTASTICAGNNTSFTVAATGTGITYQWQVSTNGGTTYANATGAPYTNGTTTTLNITNATAAMNGYMYQVVVSGACTPPATSTPVTLTVNTSPAITTQPASTSVCAGSNTSFSVVATGAGLTYQWQVSTDNGTTWANATGAPYSNGTTATLNITNATITLNGYLYRVMIAGTCTPGVTSTPAATLTVNTLPAITTQPSNVNACTGGNASFTVAATGTGITYQWQVSTNGGTTYANATGAPYSNGTTATLNITGVTSGMNGYLYQVIVSGTCTPAVTSSPAASLTVNLTPNTPTITPVLDSVCEGTSITFTASTTSPGTATYSWTGPGISTTAGNPLVIGSAVPANDGVFSAIVTINGCPSAAGNATAVVVALPSNPTVSSNSPVCAGQDINLTSSSTAPRGTITYSWSGPGTFTPGPSAQNPSVTNAQSGNAGTYTVYSTVTLGTLVCNSALAVGTNVVVNPLPTNPTLPSANTTVCQGQTLTLTASGPLGVSYVWYGPNGFTANTQTINVPNMQAVNAGIDSVFTVFPATGCRSALPATDTVSVNPLPPAPASASNSGPVCVGETLTLTANCPACTPTTTYSWTGPAGFTPTTSATPVVINNVPANDAGTYTVVSVLNGCSSATSATTTAVVNPLPNTPVASSNSPICEGVDLVLNSVSSSSPVSYVWSNGLGNAIDGLITTNQTTTLPAAAVSDAGTYKVYSMYTATGCQSAVPATLNIVINPRPATPVTTSNSPICAGDNLHLMADCPACDPATVANVTYQWTGPNGFNSASQNPNIGPASANTAGTYTTYAVLNGCLSVNPATTSVVVNPLPATPSVSSNSPICEGSTLQLNAMPDPPPTGVTYQWTGPNGYTASGTAPDRSNMTMADAGTYSVSAESLGCFSAPANVQVVVNPSPAPPIVSNITYCQNSPVYPLSATGTNILWYTTPTGGVGNPVPPIPNDALPGVTTYYATQTTGSGCESPRASLVVTVNQQSVAPFVAATTITYCQGEPASILSATGQNLLWYTTPTGGTGSFIAPTPSTAVPGNFIYYVSQNTNGCESQRAAITVIVKAKPQPPIALDVSYCENQPAVPLTAIGQNVLWYSTPVGGVGTPIGPIPSTAIPDTLTWYVTQTVNGCESDRTPQHVYIFYKPNVVILHSRNYVCQHDTMTFQYYGSALSNASYDWGLPVGASIVSGGAGGPLVVRFDSAGHLDLTLTVSNGNCKSDKVTYVVDVRPLPTATVSSKHDVCQGDVVQVGLGSVTPGVQGYNWDFDGGTIISNVGDGGPYNIQWNQAGIHVVTLVPVLNTCPGSPAATDTVDVHVMPDASIGTVSADGIICSGDSVELTAAHPNPAYQFHWTPEQFFDHGNNVPDIYGNIDFTGEVYLTVTTEYGCVGVDSTLITTQPCCGIEFPNAFTPNNDGKNDLFRPITKGNHTVKIFRVQNRWGQTVFESTDEKLGWDGTYAGVPQDMDTYYWYIDYICTSTGKETQERGEVYLIR